jgi:hypothetical protein
LIKWLIVKHQPINEEEEDLDAVEEDVEEEVVVDLKEEEEAEVEVDQTEEANQKKEELGSP